MTKKKPVNYRKIGERVALKITATSRGFKKGDSVTIDLHERVNHPQHYNQHPSGIECITVVEWFNFNLGNAIKYIWRFEGKNGLEDLKKARWYLDREIQRLERHAKAT